MKKHTLERKLVLSRKTVANLEPVDLKKFNGGALPNTFQYPTCVSVDVNCQTWERCSCGTYCI